MANINFTSKFDVIGFAKNIINEIESVRSYKMVKDDDTKDNFGAPTESRINAFFRLIGLPMFVSLQLKADQSSGQLKEGNIHLTPGYSRSFYSRMSDYDVTNDVGADLQRESTLLSEENKIGTEDKNDDMTKALGAPIPLQPNIEGEIEFDNDYTRNVYKKLKPLETLYISGGILPIKNERARPFLLSPKEQMPDNETFLSKPLIEIIIRIRLISCEGSTKEGDAETQAFMDSLSAIVGKDQFKEIFSGNTKIFSQTNILEQYIIERLLGSVVQLAKKWVEVQKRQERINKEGRFIVNIKTTSAKKSSFGRRVSISTDVTVPDETDIGTQLRGLRNSAAYQEAILSLMPTDNTTTNDSNSNIKNTSNISFASLLAPFTSLISSDLNQIKKEITQKENDIRKKQQEMESLRLDLEMMTGEFTGISVPDVVMLIIALFLLDKKNLIKLLDNYVIDDMQKDPILKESLTSLKVSSSSVSEAQTAIDQLETLIDQLYKLLDSEIVSAKDKTLRTQ